VSLDESGHSIDVGYQTRIRLVTVMDEDKLREAFARFDIDGSGLIDSAELKTALRAAYIDCGEEITDDDLEQLADVSHQHDTFAHSRRRRGAE
jgi:Ca2+-binding EF-hand superfamily protein